MITTTTGYINRSVVSWFDPTKDWTKLVILRFNSSPGAFNIPWVLSSDLTYVNPYIVFSSLPAASNLLLEYFDGVTTLDTATKTLVNGTNYIIAARYTASTHLLEFIVDGIVIGSFTANLSSFVTSKEFMLNDGETATSSIGYELLYQSALTNAQILAQKSSITPLITTNLLSNCPLQTSIDLTDHNGNARQFSATGTVTTDTSDPLLAIVAAPPSNISPGTATVIGITSAIFQNTLTAGVATNVWHKYTPTSSKVKVASIIGYGDPATYLPRVQIASGLANANAAIFDFAANTNRGVQFQVTFGTDYYIKSLRNGAVTPATLQLSVIEGLNLPIVAGSYAINDDEPTINLPLTLMDLTTGYPLNFVNNFPAGEGADILPNGKLLVTDEHHTDKSYIYDGNLNLIVSLTTLVGYERVTSDNSNMFLLGSPDGGAASVAKITFVDQFGNIGSSKDLDATDLLSLGMLNDRTVAYFVHNDGVNQPVKQINLSTGVITTLVAGIALYGGLKDIICLSDNTILVGYYKTTDIIVKRYNTSGVVQNTYNLGAYAGGSDLLDARMCRYTDDNSFVIWIKGTVQGNDIILRVKVSDGTILSATPVLAEYESGIYIAPQTPTPQRFGHSESCPIWITRVDLFPLAAESSGLYLLTGTGNVPDDNNPSLTHDTLWLDASAGTTKNVAIPDPFAETYLLGDE